MKSFTNEQLANWDAYEEIRESGEFNMFDHRAVDATGLTTDEYLFVMKNYSELRKVAMYESEAEYESI